MQNTNSGMREGRWRNLDHRLADPSPFLAGHRSGDKRQSRGRNKSCRCVLLLVNMT